MKEHKVITHQVPPDFAQQVHLALNEGWQLVGGVSTTAILKESGVYQMFYTQALSR
jgi:hypothetical protein